MNAAKITVSLDGELLLALDRLVRSRVFPSRSHAVQTAIEEKLARMKKTRLAEQCAKLNAEEEQALADVGLAAEADEWPPY